MLKKVFSLILVVSVMMSVLSVGVTVNAAERIITTLVDDDFEDRELGTGAFASGKHPDRSDAIKVDHSTTSGVEVKEAEGNKYVTLNAQYKAFSVYNSGLNGAEKIVWSFDISVPSGNIDLTLGTGTNEKPASGDITRNRFAQIDASKSRFKLYNGTSNTPTNITGFAFDTIQKVTIEMSKGTDGNIVVNEITCSGKEVCKNWNLADCVDKSSNEYMDWDTFAAVGRLGVISNADANTVKLDNVELYTVEEVIVAETIITTIVDDDFEDRVTGTESFMSANRPDRSDAIQSYFASNSGVKLAEAEGNKYVTLTNQNLDFPVYSNGFSGAKKIVWSFDMSWGDKDNGTVFFTFGTSGTNTERFRFAKLNFLGDRFDLYNTSDKSSPSKGTKFTDGTFATMQKVTIEMSKGTDGNVVIDKISYGDTTVFENQSLTGCVDSNGNSYMNWDTFAAVGRLSILQAAPSNATYDGLMKLDNIKLYTVTEVKEAEFENLVVAETATGAKATVDAVVPSGNIAGNYMLIVAGYDDEHNMLCVNVKDIVIPANATDAADSYEVAVTPEDASEISYYKGFIWATRDQKPMLPSVVH